MSIEYIWNDTFPVSKFANAWNELAEHKKNKKKYTKDVQVVTTLNGFEMPGRVFKLNSRRFKKYLKQNVKSGNVSVKIYKDAYPTSVGELCPGDTEVSVTLKYSSVTSLTQEK